MDMLHSIGNLNRLAHFDCKEDGVAFTRAHKKHEHVWRELNLNKDMQEASLGDYDCVSTDEKVIVALQRGLRSAQEICERLHMRPKGKEDKKWWVQPWSTRVFDTYANSDL
ncbi:hypothetical protein L7F22_008253 [Adiantum nelumboides]|nr:hypothetical protein [Adiantum nelumboides]